MTPAIASLVPEIAPVPTAPETAAGLGDAARFGAALEQAMLAAQAGQAGSTEPSSPPMLMLLLADLPAEPVGDAAPDEGATTESSVPSDASAVPRGKVSGSSPAAPMVPVDQAGAVLHLAAMPAGASAGKAMHLEGAVTRGPRAQQDRHEGAQASTSDGGTHTAAARPLAAYEAAADLMNIDAPPNDRSVRGAAAASGPTSDGAATADESPTITVDEGTAAEQTARPRRRTAASDPDDRIEVRPEFPATAAQVPVALQLVAQAVVPTATSQAQGDAHGEVAGDAAQTSRDGTRLDADQAATRREVSAPSANNRQQAASAGLHGLSAAREADEARSAIAMAQAAGLDPAASESASGSLPAGVRVLDLHVQAARRQHLVANDKRAHAAPRTGEEAAAALDIAAAPQAPGAEALDRLRWPTVTSLPRAATERAQAAEAPLPVLQAQSALEATRNSDTTAAPSPALDAAALAAGPAGRSETPSRDSQRNGRSRDDAPVAVFAAAMPTSTAPMRADAPAVPAAPATSAAAPQDLAPRPGGIERISVRLGDGDGAPTVRIAIRQGNVDAKVITSDAQLARDLGRSTHELASALELRGFDAAQVRVRGTPSANEMMGPVQLAGSAMSEPRQPEPSPQQDGRRSHEERAQAWRDERPEQRQQGRQPRRPRRDDDETEA